MTFAPGYDNGYSFRHRSASKLTPCSAAKTEGHLTSWSARSRKDSEIRQPERASGLKFDNQREFGRLLDGVPLMLIWQVCLLQTLTNVFGVRRLPVMKRLQEVVNCERRLAL